MTMDSLWLWVTWHQKPTKKNPKCLGIRGAGCKKTQLFGAVRCLCDCLSCQNEEDLDLTSYFLIFWSWKTSGDRPFGDENWRVGGSPHRQDEVIATWFDLQISDLSRKEVESRKIYSRIQCLLGVVFKYFYLDLYLWKIPNLPNIFQRGWNHQLVYVWDHFLNSRTHW